MSNPPIMPTANDTSTLATSSWSGFGRHFRHPALAIGFVLLVLLVLVALSAPWVAPYPPLKTDMTNTLAPMSARHWLGTDQFGRDVLSRLLLGTRISLEVAFAVVALSLSAGVLVGALAGFAGGWTERVTVVAIDILLAFPGFLLALALVAARGSSLSSVIMAVSIAFTPRVASVMRSVVLTIKPRPFIESSRAIGMTESAHSTPPRHPERAAASHRGRNGERGDSDIGRGRLELPGPRRATADADMGQRHLGRQCLDHDESLDIAVCRPLHCGGGDCFQSARRRTARHSRSADAAANRADTVMTGAANSKHGGATAHGAARPEPALIIDGLTAVFPGTQQPYKLIEDISLTVQRGETLAVVGKSGSGKSMTFLAVLGLLPHPGRIERGKILLNGVDLLQLSVAHLRALRGSEIAMVFQDPLSALNPVFTIGEQVAEVLRAHRVITRKQARTEAIALLERVQIPDPHRRVDDYPHQMSGGMRQRALIAMAISLGPKVLIADEPTTALDVTVQAQVLELLAELKKRRAWAWC